MTHKIIPVAIGLIIHNNCIVIGKRTSGHFSGYWEFPGGKIENGETSYEAMVREMDEELGIDVTKASEVIHIKDTHQAITIHLQIWQIHHYTGELIANEQQHLQWAPIHNLTNLKIIPTNTPIIHYVQQSCT